MTISVETTEQPATDKTEPVVLLPSRPIQLVTVPISAGPSNGDFTELIALCEDGSMWLQYRSNGYSNVPSDGKWRLMQPTCRVCGRVAGAM